MAEPQRDMCEAFLAAEKIAGEKVALLERYVALLLETNQKFNLIAPSTIPDVWLRHILDSAQLTKFLPSQSVSIADMGSGAGLPGIVLAILTEHKITLVESIGKKANFLREVAAQLNLKNVSVRNERIEDIRDVQADIITARALKALPELLNYAFPLLKRGGSCVFLKGAQADEELTAAAKYWKFDAQKHHSLSDNSGTVITLKNLSNLGRHVARRSA